MSLSNYLTFSNASQDNIKFHDATQNYNIYMYRDATHGEKAVRHKKNREQLLND